MTFLRPFQTAAANRLFHRKSMFHLPVHLLCNSVLRLSYGASSHTRIHDMKIILMVLTLKVFLFTLTLFMKGPPSLRCSEKRNNMKSVICRFFYAMYILFILNLSLVRSLDRADQKSSLRLYL